MKISRRRVFSTTVSGLASAAVVVRPAQWVRAVPNTSNRDLTRQVGITTSSIDAHVSWKGEQGKIALVDLPRFLRDELDMHVIDLNTRTLGSLESGHVRRFREAVDRAGCVVTNLKLNQRELDLGNRDADLRQLTMVEYRKCIDAAELLGSPWVRPYPSIEPPVMEHLVAGYRELVAYGAPKKVGLLVENYRWMESDPEAATRLIREIDRDVAASPDTGNWVNDEVRYAGLAKMFPLAATCDFKARELGPNGKHPLYDLRRCFQIGWDSGFRGPWCIEHAHPDRARLIRELTLVRDMLRGWMKEQA